jgi:hypothetical protein
MLSLFRRREPETFPDPLLPPPHVFEVDDEDERPRERAHIEWGEKPDALTRWAELAANEWTRPQPVVTPPEPAVETGSRALPWSITPPTEAGVWWYCEADSERVALCIVTDFGGRLSVAERSGDCCTYRSVASLHRFWAGPCPIPEFVELDELQVSAQRCTEPDP